jgi:hypothetical protein
MSDPSHLLNPGVIATLILAGIAYSVVLWVLDIRPPARLFIAATASGVIFLATIWATRAMQGTPSPVWAYLLVDWLIFASTGFLAVMARRRWGQR